LKIQMTSFDIAAVISELNQLVSGARIENIYQINHATLLLRLHQPNQPTMQLLIEAGRRVHLTSYAIKKPLKPPAFCMALRKHLRNGKITTVNQHEFERTIIAQVSTKEGVFQLVTELFGEGNIILVNPQGTITAALTYRRMRDRNIIRGETFKQAPSSGKNPFHLSRPDMDELKGFGQLEVVRALTKLLSIGGLYAEELLLRAEVDKKTPCQELTDQQVDSIFTQLTILMSNLTQRKLSPVIFVDDKGEWVDVTPFGLKVYERMETKPYKTFNEALDEYFTQTAQLTQISKSQMEQEREIAKLKRMLTDQQKTVEDSRKLIEQNRRIGDLIYAHLGELQLLAQQILEDKQQGKPWEQIVDGLKKEKLEGRTPSVYFDSLDSKRMILNISMGNQVFPIRLDSSAQASGAEYYERMKKAERKLKGSEKALRETLAKIEELQKLWTEKIKEVGEEAPTKREKKAWFEKFRWFYSSDGFLVVGGKDATTNEILVKKHVEAQDIVFHADIVGAPFVVVKTLGKAPSEQVIREAAQFAASYSRAWREMFSTIDVYWVRPHQVSKTPPHGQYLEKGAFVIQGAKNYVKGIPLRVGIGVQLRDNQIAVIGGPAETVSKQTNVYVEVSPGHHTGSALTNSVRSLLSEKAPKAWREKILATPKQELQSFVPFGKGEVMLK